MNIPTPTEASQTRKRHPPPPGPPTGRRRACSPPARAPSPPPRRTRARSPPCRVPPQGSRRSRPGPPCECRHPWRRAGSSYKTPAGKAPLPSCGVMFWAGQGQGGRTDDGGRGNRAGDGNESGKQGGGGGVEASVLQESKSNRNRICYFVLLFVCKGRNSAARRVDECPTTTHPDTPTFIVALDDARWLDRIEAQP